MYKDVNFRYFDIERKIINQWPSLIRFTHKIEALSFKKIILKHYEILIIYRFFFNTKYYVND